MAILNFPNSGLVANATQYTGDNGITYTWDGVKWIVQSAGIVGTISYTDLTNKPTIPTSFDRLVNGANTVSLGSDGSLTLPATGSLSTGSIYFNGSLHTGSQSQYQFEEIITGEGEEAVYSSKLSLPNIAEIFAGEDLSLSTWGSGVAIKVRNPSDFSDHTWSFDNNGSLTLPGALTFPSGGGNIRSEGNINIDINLTDSTLRRWQFGEDGDLILPAGGDIKNSTGTSVLGGGGGSSLVNGTETFTLSATGNATFSGETGGVNRGIVWDYGAVAGGVNSRIRQDEDGLTVRAYTENGGNYAAPVRILTNQGDNERVWQFDGAGDLTLPTGGDIKDSEGNSVLGGGTGDSLTSNNDINITVNSEDSSSYTWNFGQTGILTAPDDIVTGTNGGRFVQDCGDGTTSMRWINVEVDDDTTQLIRAYSGDPDGEGDSDERAQIKLNWQDEYRSGLTIRSFDRTDSMSTVSHDWKFQGDGGLELPGDIRSEGAINIDINLSDSTLHRWQFGEDGNLTFPSGMTMGYLEGAEGIQGSVNTTVGILSQGTSGAAALQWINDAENATAVATVIVNSLFAPSTGTVQIITGDVGPVPEHSWTFGPDGDLTLPDGGPIWFGGNNCRIQALQAFSISSDGGIVVEVTDKQWAFGLDGTLTLPNDGGIKSSTNIDITIDTPDSSTFNWRFGADGELTLPVGGDIVDSTGASVLGGGTSIPTVVTTGAVGVDGAAHAKVQFTVASGTEVTAVGVTVIGVSVPANSRITLSGSPGTGSFDIVAVATYTTPGDTYIFTPFATNASGTGYGAPIAGEGTNPCLVRGTLITMADMSRVAVENITYNDDILVWDFDLGEFASAKPIWIKKTQTAVVSCLLTFSDHSELQIVGDSPKAHRIFNKEAGKFTYGSMPETPIGTTTFNDQGEEITLISKEWIVGEVEFYNVMTDYHMNLFANSILTSMRYNNVYPITDMKFVKDSRTLRTADDYPNVEERLYKGFRLAEQTQSIEEIETHIQWLLSLEVEKETESV
jgi:hypothetical protein